MLAKINFISAGSVSFNYALNGDELTVEEGSTAIPEFAFRQNNLFLTVVLPTTLETIGRFAFDETSLTEVSLPDSLFTIEQGAFRRSDLTELVVPDSVVSIGASAFDNTDLAAVRLPESLTSIGDYAFYNTPLTQVIIPESVQALGRGAFAATNIESVVVPASFAGNLPTNAFNPGTEITLSAEAPAEEVREEPTAEAPAEEVREEPTIEPSASKSPGSPSNAASSSNTASSSSSAPSDRSASESLGAVNQVVDSIQRVVDKVIQVGDSVRISSSDAEIIVPEKFSDLISIDHSLANKIALNASSFVKNLDVEMQVPGLQLDAKKMAKSDIVFASGLNAELVSEVRKMKKVTISMFKGDDVLRFVDGVIMKSSVSTGQGDDQVILGQDVTVGKNSKFRLGEGSDQVDIQGEVEKMKINLGDDRNADVVSLEAEDLISKKLKISNFNREDRLIVDGDVFGYSDLRDNDFDRIKIRFAASSSIGKVIDSLGISELSDIL